MEGLQRSSSTFRRSGSSGLVWDERFLTEGAEAKAPGEGGGTDEAQPEMRRSRSTGGVGMLLRRGSDDKKQQQKKERGLKKKDEDRDQQVFRTKDVAPDMDPPSPRVSGCILCAIFGGSGAGSGPVARRGRAKPKRKQRSAA